MLLKTEPKSCQKEQNINTGPGILKRHIMKCRFGDNLHQRLFSLIRENNFRPDCGLYQEGLVK